MIKRYRLKVGKHNSSKTGIYICCYRRQKIIMNDTITLLDNQNAGMNSSDRIIKLLLSILVIKNSITLNVLVNQKIGTNSPYCIVNSECKCVKVRPLIVFKAPLPNVNS